MERKSTTSAASPATAPIIPSHGLAWLWQHLQDVRQPHFLDCGAISPATLNILLRRNAKVFVADLITPAVEGDPTFWDRSRKKAEFLPRSFLGQLPAIPAGSLSAILSWNLLDLLPHEALPAVAKHLFSLLNPSGVLLCILREPYLHQGVGRRWWLDDVTSYRSETVEERAFPYPPITNREMENLVPGSIKIFLTRSGRREMLATKQP